VKYTKYVAHGNSFVVVDNREKKFPERRVQEICQAEQADGVLLLEDSTKAQFRMRIINNDGTEAAMCGNGTRVLFHFAFHFLDFEPNEKGLLSLEAENAVYVGKVEDNLARVYMSELYDLGRYKIDRPKSLYLNTGVPHVVCEVEDLDAINIEAEAKPIRNDSQFKDGSNVDFIKVGEKSFDVRTFERGVEGETLSCGTGMMASAYYCREEYGWTGEIDVHSKGGKIKIFLDESGVNNFMEGLVECQHIGEIDETKS